ncbi:LOW QUALITY PROTEIN: uncharacterized protein ACOB7L_010340 [Callospermophilus lateralis]
MESKLTEKSNTTMVMEFILLGFSDTPHLQWMLFGIFLLLYLTILTCNSIIMLITQTDSSLQTPMYFFLSNFSFVEICYVTVTIPRMLMDFCTQKGNISLYACSTQMCFVLLLGGTECLLLTAMAYDRYVAICNPLHYPLVMSHKVCMQLVAASWVTAIQAAIGLTYLIFSLPFCGSNRINHFFCDIPPVLQLACGDTSMNNIAVYMSSMVFFLIPFLLISASYGKIISNILKMPSARGRAKAFSTCSSHLTVVVLFYGTASITYLQPKSNQSEGTGKLLSLFYTILIPTLNPIIYTLRNKDITMALRKLLTKLLSWTPTPDLEDIPSKVCIWEEKKVAYFAMGLDDLDLDEWWGISRVQKANLHPPLMHLKEAVRETNFLESNSGQVSGEEPVRTGKPNTTTLMEFVLLGFSDIPHLQWMIFGIFLFLYFTILMCNSIIILITKTDPALQTPMYFFLSNFSVLEICYVTATMPRMLMDLCTQKGTISFYACATQMCFVLLLGGTECLLLTVMAYDRYVAICNPLQYPVVMSHKVCIQLVAASWVSGIPVEIGQTYQIFSLPFCGSNKINHFFCDIPPLLNLACGDTFVNEMAVYVVAVLFVMVPFILISASYGKIISNILKMSSARGRAKAFSTCSSHLMVVVLFYGTASITYLQPKSNQSDGTGKLLSLFCTILIPALNPIIYTLRNKDITMALKKLLTKLLT